MSSRVQAPKIGTSAFGPTPGSRTSLTSAPVPSAKTRLDIEAVTGSKDSPMSRLRASPIPRVTSPLAALAGLVGAQTGGAACASSELEAAFCVRACAVKSRPSSNGSDLYELLERPYRGKVLRLEARACDYG